MSPRTKLPPSSNGMSDVGKRRDVRVYRRGDGRWYGDFRHLGGDRRALIAEGEKNATTDELVAGALYVAHAKELLEGRRARNLGIARKTQLRALGVLWLEDRQREHAARGTPRLSTLNTNAYRLDNIVSGLERISGQGTNLVAARVDAGMVEEYALQRELAGYTLQTVTGEVATLSIMFRWAVRRRYLSANVIREVVLPKVDRVERPFLEPVQAGYVLRASELVGGKLAGALVPLLLFTGGRRDEVGGLDADDIDRGAGVVHIRSNRWRDLKTGKGRTVPIWPQLRRYLPPVVAGPLFPGNGRRRGGRAMGFSAAVKRVVTEARALAKRDKVDLPATITPHTFRHTYCAMRLQTLDAGEPVALFTVMRELGWANLKMVEQIYGHLPKDRRRLERVEYPLPGRLKVKQA